MWVVREMSSGESGVGRGGGARTSRTYCPPAAPKRKKRVA
jgi:hypothetical protein